MRMITMAVVVVTLASRAAGSAEPVSFNPAALMSRETAANHAEFSIAVFPPAGKQFEISLPLIPRWFAYGPSGRSVYATALVDTGRGSITTQRGILKIELDPVRVSNIEGLDAFYRSARLRSRRARIWSSPAAQKVTTRREVVVCMKLDCRPGTSAQ